MFLLYVSNIRLAESLGLIHAIFTENLAMKLLCIDFDISQIDFNMATRVVK